MTHLFLNAKHWQIFLIAFGVPMIFQFVMMDMIMSEIQLHPESEPLIAFNYFWFFPILMIICGGVFFGWFWSVAIGLQKLIPEDVKMKVNKFKLFFFIPTGYLFSITIFMSIFLTKFLIGDVNGDGLGGGWVGIILPLHLLSMFGIFYSMYFVAKTLKTVELQRAVKFSDFAGEFFMIWMYPIGIWILQPKINRMVEGDLSDEEMIQ